MSDIATCSGARDYGASAQSFPRGEDLVYQVHVQLSTQVEVPGRVGEFALESSPMAFGGQRSVPGDGPRLTVLQGAMAGALGAGPCQSSPKIRLATTIRKFPLLE